MQIPETPPSVVELDLMIRLDDYANGKATWSTDNNAIGETAKHACRTLHTNLTNLINGVFAFILDRVTAREMEMFTMHDRVHGRKVAHLMWHILRPERRLQLTPAEIGMLVVAAHLHDLGLGLSPSERAERLSPDSDLWDKLEIQDSVRTAIQGLREQIGDQQTTESVKKRAEQQLFQAEEALLTQDTRERHATRERYQEILNLLTEFHQKDPVKIPDIDASLSFDGDSFRDKLIDVCMSHNEDADALVGNDERNLGRPRFPKDFPVGSCNADLHLVAAALRLADILDFDRERTPAVLFHYLLPTTLGRLENRSVLEWSKHLAISNWHIERNDIIFRGRSKSHILHHAVVQFCSVIVDELKATHATFNPLSEEGWPFALPLSVKADIHEDGYRYVPYKFELDDERVYSLLMGGAIYDNPLVAVRELVQNAVDACKLRDSLTRLYEEYEEPSKINRIVIRYEEPTPECAVPRLTVRDTGIGMDAYTLERYFLQVGRSYYNSSDFNQFRVQLRKKNYDFAPVSEFGIGFLSTFLLADHVEVETAMWEPLRGDTIRRLLKIDGPTRLIRLDEQRNDGAGRFKGTQITLFLSAKISKYGELRPASWLEIKKYLMEVCQDLPYRLNLEHVSSQGKTEENIDALPLSVTLTAQTESAALRIAVDDKEFGLEGEIIVVNPLIQLQQESERRETAVILLNQDEVSSSRVLDSTLLRGGFKVGQVEGLPLERSSMKPHGGARLRLTWVNRRNKRYLAPNLARNSLSDNHDVGGRVLQLWLSYYLRNAATLPEGQFYNLTSLIYPHSWIEEFSGIAVYQLARQDWVLQLRDRGFDEKALTSWEASKGEPLWYHFSSLGRMLLDLVLPRVTGLELKESGEIYIASPANDWQTTLENCQNYMQSRIDWGQFMTYEEKIDRFIFYNQPGYYGSKFNLKYKERFAGWTREEVSHLRFIINSILDDRYTDQPQLSASNSLLFRRALETIGDLHIGNFDEAFTLNSIKVTEL